MKDGHLLAASQTVGCGCLAFFYNVLFCNIIGRNLLFCLLGLLFLCSFF